MQTQLIQHQLKLLSMLMSNAQNSNVKHISANLFETLVEQRERDYVMFALFRCANEPNCKWKRKKERKKKTEMKWLLSQTLMIEINSTIGCTIFTGDFISSRMLKTESRQTYFFNAAKSCFSTPPTVDVYIIQNTFLGQVVFQSITTSFIPFIPHLSYSSFPWFWDSFFRMIFLYLIIVLAILPKRKTIRDI